MATVVTEEFRRYFGNLTATSGICTAAGTTWTEGTNLFVGFEAQATHCLVIHPYGGGPPTPEGDRQEARIQIMYKSPTRRKVLNVQQSIINTLHNNTNICASSNGRVSAIQSTPIVLGVREGGESVISVSNYTVKHTKI